MYECPFCRKVNFKCTVIELMQSHIKAYHPERAKAFLFFDSEYCKAYNQNQLETLSDLYNWMQAEIINVLRGKE